MITAADTIVGQLDFEEQRLLVAELGRIRRMAPLFVPVTNGLDMSVKVTNAGPRGWCATSRDRTRFPFAQQDGYYYAERHPVTGEPWPDIPPLFLEIAERFVDRSQPVMLPFDCAHVVFYGPGAVLGWHRDKTEEDKRGQIITISLGDPASWWVDDEEGAGKTEATLYSGMVTRLAGESRSVLHRIARVDTNPTCDLLNPSPLAGPGRAVISLRSGVRRARAA